MRYFSKLQPFRSYLAIILFFFIGFYHSLADTNQPAYHAVRIDVADLVVFSESLGTDGILHHVIVEKGGKQFIGQSAHWVVSEGLYSLDLRGATTVAEEPLTRRLPVIETSPTLLSFPISRNNTITVVIADARLSRYPFVIFRGIVSRVADGNIVIKDLEGISHGIPKLENSIGFGVSELPLTGERLSLLIEHSIQVRREGKKCE